MSTVHATFHDRDAADRACDDLIAAGFSPDDISLVVSNTTRERFFPSQGDGGLDKDVSTGGAGGGVLGAGLGAVAGGLLLGGVLTAATGGIAAPFLVAGPLAGALMGGVSGAAVGSLLGGLIGAGISKPVAEGMDQGVREGGLVVCVDASADQLAAAEAILLRDHGVVAPASDAPIAPT